jgi:hypothetical protein
MTADAEVPIGALRADGTEKPEAGVMRDMARFAREISGRLGGPEPPDVAIVTSQAAQFSAIRELEIDAQRKAVRAAAYVEKMPVYIVAENQIAKLNAPKFVILPSAQALAQSTWQALLLYVKAGGNLLVTGPIDRDPHWRRTDRRSAIGLDATVEPLTIHHAAMAVNSDTVQLSFDRNAQGWLEMLKFKDGPQLKETAYGSGRLFWAPYPVELAEGTGASAALYSAVFREIGLKPPFEVKSAPAPGVLIYPTILQNSVLYVMVSETDQDADLDLTDRTTGAELKLRVAAQHAALALLEKSSGAVIARYGF